MTIREIAWLFKYILLGFISSIDGIWIEGSWTVGGLLEALCLELNF